MLQRMTVGRITVKRMTAVVLGLGAAAVLVGCSGQKLEDITPEVGVTEVSVEDNTFGPRVIEVPAGTEVTWTWEGNNDHNVVGDDFESEVMKDGTFQHTFDEARRYEYACTLHGNMTAAVEVVE